ncbi:hypothetical protein VPH35_137526 [Triticum aestivum]
MQISFHGIRQNCYCVFLIEPPPRESPLSSSVAPALFGATQVHIAGPPCSLCRHPGPTSRRTQDPMRASLGAGPARWHGIIHCRHHGLFNDTASSRSTPQLRSLPPFPTSTMLVSPVLLSSLTSLSSFA